MRGNDIKPDVLYGVINLEERIPKDHPLRRIREMIDQALGELWDHFEALYAPVGRPSIPPERLLRALLLQVLYAIRSELQLMERIKYDLLFRWFVGLGLEEEEWDSTVFTKNRDRLMEGEIAQHLLEAVMEQARSKKLLSEEHFTVDGTILEAWAGRKSFVPKDPGSVVGTGVGGKKCLRDTHESKTDPQARLYKKSTAGEAKPSYLGHVIIENRNGLVVAACATQSSTTAEREAALAMLDEMGLVAERIPPADQRITLGADKLYQEEKFIEGLRQRHVAPHVAEYEPSAHWPNFLTEAERNHPGFSVSQKKRKLVEMVFGWGKLDSIMRKIKLHGLHRVDWIFRFLATAHNLVRMLKLIPAQ
jgi:transposase